MADWQPIETVEDGATVLVYAPNEVTRTVFEAIAYRNGSYNDPVYDEWDGNGVTHWMPLPLPPVAMAWDDAQMRNLESKKAGLCCCYSCVRRRGEVRAFMIVCTECGNKRCPKASDHALACTGSNEPGQDGSVY